MGENDDVSLFAREIVYEGGEYVLKSIACGITGRDGIEANVWYRAVAGKLVRA